VILANNNEALDPTWEQLVSFLLEDGTDEQIYLGGFRVCADFATQLHNNAEAAGIKAAFVSIELQDNPGGHALNAFQVVDKGLVYIDCTGTEIQPITFEEWLGNQETPLERDKVAYAAVGKEYGLVSVNVARATDYEFYESYVQQWEEYDQQLALYNTKADVYDKALAGRAVIADPREYAKLKEMYDELEAMRAELEALRVKLGGHRWQPLGIVMDIELYW